MTTDNNEMVFQVLDLITVFLVTNRNIVKNWKLVAMEEEYRLQFEGYEYAFKPDLVVSENGKKIVLDYKFPYDFYLSDVAALLPQIPRYVGALRALGHAIHGGSYIFLRTRKITDPDKPRTKLQSIPMGNRRIVNAIKDLDKVAKEINHLKSLPRAEWDEEAIRSANGMNCKNCQFLELCVIENSGEDTAVIRRVSYKTSTYGYTEAKE
jgi:PD-(D/E)XK nuclease superfamily